MSPRASPSTRRRGTRPVTTRGGGARPGGRTHRRQLRLQLAVHLLARDQQLRPPALAELQQRDQHVQDGRHGSPPGVARRQARGQVGAARTTAAAVRRAGGVVVVVVVAAVCGVRARALAGALLLGAHHNRAAHGHLRARRQSARVTPEREGHGDRARDAPGSSCRCSARPRPPAPAATPARWPCRWSATARRTRCSPRAPRRPSGTAWPPAQPPPPQQQQQQQQQQERVRSHQRPERVRPGAGGAPRRACPRRAARSSWWW
eukprot:scaffold1897_cov279-Prasinococcus_capsulatus_cf.AAC.2